MVEHVIKKSSTTTPWTCYQVKVENEDNEKTIVKDEKLIGVL
jgi:hypothetical protein